jgi:hypothetical protein
MMGRKEIDFITWSWPWWIAKRSISSLGVSHGGLQRDQFDRLPNNQFSLGWIAKRSSFISWRYS